METNYRGKWEEVILHAEELRGKEVVVTVVEQFRKLTPEELIARRAALDAFFNELDSKTLEPPPPRTKPDAFGDALVEKYRRQGFDL